VAEKPTLSLIPGNALTVENLAALFEKLTGRKPTEEELAEARAILEADQASPPPPSPAA
jgi:hypothetical protein